jgi:hypothetical protein
MLDDDENIAEYLRQTGGHSFGRVVKKDQPDEPLYLRDLTNKIIHAHHLEWDFSIPDGPKLVCISSRMLKKSFHGLFQLASPRRMSAARSENQTLGCLIFDAARPCGA